MSIPDRQAFRIGSPMRSPSPIRQTNRSPAPFSGNKITSIIVNSISRPGTPSERADSRIEVITPDVHYYEPSSRYTPDLPNRTLVQAPTNYRDFLQTTPPAGRRAESNPADGDVKVTKIIRKVPPSPGSHRKISTGSQSGRVRRVPPKEKQPVLIASIANFDGQEQRKHSSVKPPRISSGAQTDFSDTGSDVVQPGAEISISIQAGLDFAGSQISRRKDSRGKCQVELVNSPSHSRASSNVCTRELVLSPPPTPPPPRKTSLADEIISKNEDMLSSFPPPPARNLHEFQIGNELEGLPPQEPASGSPKVPPKPRLDRKTSLKLKQRAHVNSQEVHRSKAGVFDLENKPDTPIFSDAENSHFSAAILSDGKTTAADDTEIESVRVLDDDMDSLAAVSVYQESDTENQTSTLHLLTPIQIANTDRQEEDTEAHLNRGNFPSQFLSEEQAKQRKDRAGGVKEEYLKEERLYRVLHDKHYDGIGPTHDEIPLALKSTVDKPKDWYKSMFKAMHKAGRSGNIADTGADISDYLDEEKFKQNVKIRSNPGSISKWSPGDAYVAENEPKPTYSELLYPTTHLARDKKASLRGESARDTISEIASKPWAEYLSDVESLPVPKKLMDDLPTNQINVCNPAPVAPIKPLNILEGSIITSKRNYVTPAQKAVGAYMQTTSRQLVPETVQDAELYISGAKSGRQTAKATFDFKGRSERELSVTKNEIVLITNDIDDKWYECELRGRKGLVPKNYVQFTNQFHVLEYGEARGKHDFRKKNKTQLSFERDEEIQLIRAIDQNWYEARIGAHKGYVPKNHLLVVKEPITNQDDRIGHDLISPANSRSSSRANSRPASTAISDSAARASPEKSNASQAVYDLNSAADDLANLSASVADELSDDARPEWIPKDSERFQAVYDYTPQHEDELKLTSGDFVYVFEKCGDGWFIGAHGSSGNIGTFPGNYTAKA